MENTLDKCFKDPKTCFNENGRNVCIKGCYYSDDYYDYDDSGDSYKTVETIDEEYESLIAEEYNDSDDDSVYFSNISENEEVDNFQDVEEIECMG